jgi:FAD/FMN-containing dehydrogenase
VAGGGKSEQPVRDAHGPNFARLAALKKRYDPTNFLTSNQNIQPSE